MTPVEPIRSVLLVQSGAMGDCVLQLRIAEAIRRALPAARIAWRGRDEWLPIAQRCGSVDEALGLDAVGAHRLFQAGLETDADLADRCGRFDLILNGLAASDSPAAARLERIARRAAICYESRPQAGVARHVCRQWLNQISTQAGQISAELAAAIDQYATSLDRRADALLRPLAGDLAEASLRLRAAGVDVNARPQRLVLLHPGSGGLHKCWPLGNYAALADVLSAQGLRPIILAGPAELERWDEQMRGLGSRCTVIADPPLPALIGLAAMAAGYVGNDAGPTHLAAAVGAPTVALFGPTDPQVWRPLGPGVQVLRSAEHERGWGDLAPEAVAMRVDDLTEQEGSTSPR
jgi:heptosyltransferase-3